MEGVREGRKKINNSTLVAMNIHWWLLHTSMGHRC